MKIVIGVVLFVLLVLIIRWIVRKLRIRRFHRSAPGIYRGGQPNPMALWMLARIFGVRTIINLREDYIENTNLFGMKEYRILLPPRTNIPTMEQVDEFLQIMDEHSAYPMLIHCKVGANRTGIMMATWRIARQGWSHDDALAEMKQISGKIIPDHALDCLQQIATRFEQKAQPQNAIKA